MDLTKIGNFIAECRKEHNLTQEQLADKLGITYKAVSKWECGKGLPDVSIFKELCNILGITLNELFEGRKLNIDEVNDLSEKNIISLMMTKKRLENIRLLTDILITVGIIITISLTSLIADNAIQKVITFICGTFVWGFGLFLKVELEIALKKLNND